ncbi:MAG: diacylglycerol/polyprenol kinase family protein [Candidatus Asgardarchaeia archaeon]
MIALEITMWDLTLMGIAYLYVVIIISIGELLRKKLNYSISFTRKLIHLFAGFSAYIIPFQDNPWSATIVAITFVILLYFSSPNSPIKVLSRWFETMADREDEWSAGHIMGPVYYSISITVLVALFTFILPVEYSFTAAAGLTAMYLGDGLGTTIGLRYGKHKYRAPTGGTRSLEGSLAVFVGSFVGAMIAIVVFGIFGFNVVTINDAIVLSLIAAIVATIVEAISPSLYDNFTVPLITTLAVYISAMYLGIIV